MGLSGQCLCGRNDLEPASLKDRAARLIQLARVHGDEDQQPRVVQVGTGALQDVRFRPLDVDLQKRRRLALSGIEEGAHGADDDPLLSLTQPIGQR